VLRWVHGRLSVARCLQFVLVMPVSVQPELRWLFWNVCLLWYIGLCMAACHCKAQGLSYA
jgi:hypothetical protein